VRLWMPYFKNGWSDCKNVLMEMVNILSDVSSKIFNSCSYTVDLRCYAWMEHLPAEFSAERPYRCLRILKDACRSVRESQWQNKDRYGNKCPKQIALRRKWTTWDPFKCVWRDWTGK
jgi:hypothetical protein